MRWRVEVRSGVLAGDCLAPKPAGADCCLHSSWWRWLSIPEHPHCSHSNDGITSDIRHQIVTKRSSWSTSSRWTCRRRSWPTWRASWDWSLWSREDGVVRAGRMGAERALRHEGLAGVVAPGYELALDP